MEINTETVRVEKTIGPWLDLTVRGVYDGISGATPTGAPALDQLTLRQPKTHTPTPSTAITGYTRSLNAVSGASPGAAGGSAASSRNTIPLADSHDIRRGIDVATALTFGANRLTPEFSYSRENDYISYAGALNYALELNEKNTILNVGWSHSYDQVLANSFTYLTSRAIKNSDDFLVGFTQVLTPQTLMSMNATIGHEEGYLNDPYRSVVFDETSLDANARALLEGEKRPSTRDSQAVLLSLTQAIQPLDGSIEAGYRFYHDSYGIIANTIDVAWYQKIGQMAVMSPSLRYYRQGAAHFYDIQFAGDPINDPGRVPRYYSSDYRLSFLEAFTVGIEGTIKLSDQFDLKFGYQRYWLGGLDHQTRQSTYPGANIFTIGLNYSF
jgi:hypothetical protein